MILNLQKYTTRRLIYVYTRHTLYIIIIRTLSDDMRWTSREIRINYDLTIFIKTDNYDSVKSRNSILSMLNTLNFFFFKLLLLIDSIWPDHLLSVSVILLSAYCYVG